MIVAIMGFDGTGKSTVVSELKKIFLKKGKKVTIVSGYKSFLERFIGLFLVDKKNKTKQKDLHKTRRGLLFYLIPYIILFDSIIRLLYYEIKSLNQIVIYDRYFYDYIASYQYTGKDPLLILRKIYSTFPKPNYSFCLISSPKDAFMRKNSIGDLGDAKIDYFYHQYKCYRRLCKNKKIRIIKTSKNNLDETLNIINEVLLL